MRALGRTPRRDALLVGFVCALGVVLTTGWLASGRASAPDNGLLQIDMLSLRERVPGVVAVDGKPTMVVLAGRCSSVGVPSLSGQYGVVVHDADEPGYDALARSLALPEAARRCQPGYALVDVEGFVRYRSYDPGWAQHAVEQSILLDEL